MAQADNLRLRRENAALDLRLRETRTERYEEFDRKCQAYDDLSKAASEERNKLLERIEAQRSLTSNTQAELDTAHARIRELVVRLRHKGELLAKSQITSKRLADERQALSSSNAQLRSALKRSEASRERAQHLMELDLKNLGKQHAQTIQRIIYLVLLLHGFCRHLGSRLILSIRARDSLHTRWKTLSAQKVEAKRTLVRYRHSNQDLKQQLDERRAQEEALEGEALKYRAMYNDSVKARKDAARAFEGFYWHALSRYSSATAKLLIGILVLWRMNLILSKRLANSELSVCNLSRELKLGLAALNPKTSDAGVQCYPVPSPSKRFAEASIKSLPPTYGDGLCSSLVPPVDTAAKTTLKAGHQRSVTKSALPSESRFASGGIPSVRNNQLDTGLNAPLILPLPIMDLHSPATLPPRSTEPTTHVDADRAELNERLQRLVKKFDALNSVHHAYRDLLIQKTRVPPASVVSQFRRGSSKPRESIFERPRSLSTSIHAS